jgi:hypothetical protein
VTDPQRARARSRLALRATLAAATVGVAVYLATLTYGARVGIDFYQYWGIGAATRLIGEGLGSPYRDVEGYASVLDRHASTSGDERLTRANHDIHARYPRGLDPTNSPLLYVLFSPLPTGYSSAYAIFLGLRVVLLLAALVLLVPPGGGGIATLATALAVVGLYLPLGADARVGNLNALQLFAIVALARLIASAGPVAGGPTNYLRGGGALAGMALLTLVKPNVAPAAAALAISLAVRMGSRALTRASAIAGPLVLVFLLLPCAYFGTWNIWGEWLEFLAPGSKLAQNELSSGNFSSALLVSRAFGLPVNGAAVAVALLLATSATVALARADARARIRAMLHDPFLAVSLAICAFLAASPLAWFHYYVLLLAPVLRMVATPSSGRAIKALGGAALLLGSGAAGLLPELAAAVPYMVALSWAPAWAGTLLLVGEAARREAAQASPIPAPVNAGSPSSPA